MMLAAAAMILANAGVALLFATLRLTRRITQLGEEITELRATAHVLQETFDDISDQLQRIEALFEARKETLQ